MSGLLLCPRGWVLSDIGRTLILLQAWGRSRHYIPSYNCGFVLDGSIFFHKSGQIWEITGLPKEWTLRSKYSEYLSHFGKYMANTVYPLPPGYPDLCYSLTYVRGKLYLKDGNTGELTRLGWRRVPMAEILIRQQFGKDS